MTTEDFFDSQSDDSWLKTDIVYNHFASWLNIIGNATRQDRRTLAYVELLAGAGIFTDGNKSTPILVAEKVLSSPFANRFKFVLNEVKDAYADRLQANLTAIPGFASLRVPPVLTREDVTHNHRRFLDEIQGMPAVLFVDPWGYRGVSLALFDEFMSGADMGRDAILFFNYRRVTAAVSNELFSQHMQVMFGRERAARLASDVEHLTGSRRELKVFSAIEEALKEVTPLVQRFEFTKRGDNLIFLTRHSKGLDVVKSIMARRSEVDDEGVASFSYDSRPKPSMVQGSLFKEPSKLDELRVDLLKRFAGQTISFQEIVQSHNVGTCYVRSNYRDILLQMEQRDEVSTDQPNRRAGTFAPHVLVTFPRRS